MKMVVYDCDSKVLNLLVKVIIVALYSGEGDNDSNSNSRVD